MSGRLALPPHEAIVARLVGDRGRMRDIRFREGGTDFTARVNEDSLWAAVKDNLVLAEYERCGIVLADRRGLVIDAGAHVGLFSLLASAHARRVIALEPHPENFALLSENLARNGRTNVDARRLALWTEAGELTLREGRDSTSGAVGRGVGASVVAPAETLESLVTEPVDLLKVDIEGAEYDVLGEASDAALAPISAIVAEVHGFTRPDGDAALARVVERLRGAGFEVAVRKAPAAYWREAMGAVVASRRRLRGELRLRAAVAASYTLAAATDPLLGLRSRLEFGFAFLFATRSRVTSR